jgi:hypothetical protein
MGEVSSGVLLDIGNNCFFYGHPFKLVLLLYFGLSVKRTSYFYQLFMVYKSSGLTLVNAR